MKQTIVLAFGLMAAITAQAASLYKCEDPQTGAVTYSQVQCGTNAEAIDVGENVSPNPGSQVPDINSYATSKGYVAEFSGNALSQMNQAIAYIDMAKNLGHGCDWAIDVSQYYTKCMDFLAYVAPQGPYAKALDKMIRLMDTNPELASGTTAGTVREGRYHAEQVEKYKAKAIAWSKMR